MNIDTIHLTLLSLARLSEQLGSAREHRADLQARLRSAAAMRELRLARTTFARELGLPLCGCCWWPEVLVTMADGTSRCPAVIWREEAAHEIRERAADDFVCRQHTPALRQSAVEKSRGR